MVGIDSSADLPARTPRKKQTRLKAEQINQMNFLYGQGWSVAELAKHFGVVRTTIYSQLKRSGVMTV